MTRLIIIALLAAAFIIACTGKRPDGNGDEFTLTIDGQTILKGATVKVLKGTDEIKTGLASDTGTFKFENISASVSVYVTACGGKFFSIGTNADVSFNGCLVAVVPVTQSGNATVYVDFISTLIAAYDSTTAEKEVLDYLQLTKAAPAVEETTLTDSTKAYLWQQAVSLNAKILSTAAGITPETSLSTEVLMTKIIADLKDNNTIDGSTNDKFGGLPVNESVFRKDIASFVLQVSDKFKRTDLEAWTHHLKTAPAKFLGTGGETPDTDNLIPDTDIVATEPNIEILSPKDLSTQYGTISVDVRKAVDSLPLTFITCKLNYKDGETQKSIDLEDKDPSVDTFKTSIDTVTLQLPDTSYILLCTGSTGTKTIDKSARFDLKNNNEVVVLPYVFDKMLTVESVTVKKLDGTTIKTVYPDTEGTISLMLSPDTYLFQLDGGSYASATIKEGENPRSFDLETPLLSRATVEVGKTTKVYINVLTTLREYIYNALAKTEDPELALTESLDLLKLHFLKTKDIDPYSAVAFGEPAQNANKLYFATLALEYTTVMLSKEHVGSETDFLLSDILKMLKKDIEDTLFDGKDKNNETLTYKKYNADSYLFRYNTGLALKVWLFNWKNENHTVATYTDMIKAISEDDSKLFPKSEKPKKLITGVPELKNLKFVDFTGATVDYKESEGKIPYTTDNFLFVYDLILADANETIASKIFSAVAKAEEVSVIGETNTVRLYIADEGELNIKLTVTDTEMNSAEANFRAIKDITKPAITKFAPIGGITAGQSEPLFGAAFKLDYAITEAHPLAYTYTIKKDDAAAGTPITIDIASSGTEIIPTLTGDGLYAFELTALDKAGNSEKKTTSARLDTTAPTGTLTIYNTEDLAKTVTTDWINFNKVKVSFENMVDRANSKVTYRYAYTFGGVLQKEGTTATTATSWEDALPTLTESLKSDPIATKHTITAKITDEAGNEKIFNNIEFFVDTVVPVLTVSASPVKPDQQPKPVQSWSYTYTATDNNVKESYYTVNNGINKIALPTGTDNQLTFSCSSMTDGTYSFKWHIEDYAGNVKEETRFLILDCTPPLLNPDVSNQPQNPLAGVTDNSFLQKLPPFELWASEQPVKITLTARKSNGDVAATHDYTYTGSPVKIAVNALPFSLIDGFYTFDIIATDEAGNISTPASKPVTLDTTKPIITFNPAESLTPLNPDLLTPPTTEEVKVTETNYSDCQYTLNALYTGSSFAAPFTVSLSTTAYPTGTLNENDINTISITCTDKAQNTNTATYQYYYDTEAPAITLESSDIGTVDDSVTKYYGQCSPGVSCPIMFRMNYSESASIPYVTRTLTTYCEQSEFPSNPEEPANPASVNWIPCTLRPSYTMPATYDSGNDLGCNGTKCHATHMYQESDLIFAEGRNWIRFYSVDSAGNSGKGKGAPYERVMPFIIDRTSPLIYLYSSASHFSTTAEAEIEFLTDTSKQKNPNNYTNSMVIAAFTDGGTLIQSKTCIAEAWGDPVDWDESPTNYRCILDSLTSNFSGYLYVRATDNLGNGVTNPSLPTFFDNCSTESGSICYKHRYVVDAAAPELAVSIVDAENNGDYIKRNEALNFSITTAGAPDQIACVITDMNGSTVLSNPNTCGMTAGSWGYDRLSALTDGAYKLKITTTKTSNGKSATSETIFYFDKTDPVISKIEITPCTGSCYYRIGTSQKIDFTLQVSDSFYIKNIKLQAASYKYRNQTTGTVQDVVSGRTVYTFDPFLSTTLNTTFKIPADNFVDGGSYYDFVFTITDNAGNIKTQFLNTSNIARISIAEKNEYPSITVLGENLPVGYPLNADYIPPSYTVKVVPMKFFIDPDITKYAYVSFKSGTAHISKGDYPSAFYGCEPDLNTANYYFIQFSRLGTYDTCSDDKGKPCQYINALSYKIGAPGMFYNEENFIASPENTTIELVDKYGITSINAISPSYTYGAGECPSVRWQGGIL